MGIAYVLNALDYIIIRSCLPSKNILQNNELGLIIFALCLPSKNI